MILPLHIIIALAGLLLSIVTYFYPSRTRIQLTYGLTGLTVLTGAYLVVSLHSPLVRSCMVGLAYLTVVLIASAMARRKLATE